jgi:hypothetical protein
MIEMAVRMSCLDEKLHTKESCRCCRAQHRRMRSRQLSLSMDIFECKAGTDQSLQVQKGHGDRSKHTRNRLHVPFRRTPLAALDSAFQESNLLGKTRNI